VYVFHGLNDAGKKSLFFSLSPNLKEHEPFYCPACGKLDKGGYYEDLAWSNIGCPHCGSE
jgi:hypothetical protein